MKKYIILFLLTAVFMVLTPSCLEDYLDVSYEAGVSEDEVFSNYQNFRSYFYGVYEGQKYYGTSGWRDYNIKLAYPLYFLMWDQKYSWEGVTDAADHCRYMEGHTLKSGQVSAFINKFTYDGNRRPILESMFLIIRKCNMVIKNIDKLQDATATQEVKDDFLGQAHFVRALAHFELMRLWGPMPYLTKVIGPTDQWDIPRLSKYETLTHIAMDMDSAAMHFEKCGKMRRDPGPGEVGHLSDAEQARPNGVAAKAYKSRALLYAASPLNNDKGQKAWEDAAKASWEAIQIAEQYKYALLTAADYKKNYVGATYTNEQLYAWNAGNQAWNSGNFQGLVSAIFNGTSSNTWSGLCPTQNFVDKFETKWGEPLSTPEERAAAEAAGHYKEQDPYANRDPRFYIDIVYNQGPLAGTWTGGKAQIYYEIKNGVPVYSELLNQTFINPTRYTATGYYIKKTWAEGSVKYQQSFQYTDPLMRLAELYLNYAEAVNEAYGPNGTAPGASMTAVQAINKVRNRIGAADVLPQFTSSKEVFRERIKNERHVELAYEGHYYHDIRRWKDAPKAYGGPIMGMDIEKVPVSATYPTGFKYTRIALEGLRQSRWKDAMYYLPFNTDDNFKMKNFVPNEVW